MVFTAAPQDNQRIHTCIHIRGQRFSTSGKGGKQRYKGSQRDVYIGGMDISINTPALLFPAISLIMLAYTNRFLALSNRVRSLHDKYQNHEQKLIIHGQIKNLRYRLKLIKNMQALGVISFLASILCMFLIYTGYNSVASAVFAFSLLSFAVSLGISFLEIRLSTRALELELSDMEGLEDPSVLNYLKKKFDRD
jgi:hypothetical protein